MQLGSVFFLTFFPFVGALVTRIVNCNAALESRVRRRDCARKKGREENTLHSELRDFFRNEQSERIFRTVILLCSRKRASPTWQKSNNAHSRLPSKIETAPATCGAYLDPLSIQRAPEQSKALQIRAIT